MDILLWIILIIFVSKIALKAFAPYTNKALDNKILEYWENLKNYF